MVKKTILLACVLTTVGGCIVTPESVLFNGTMVGTYSSLAGCNELELDEDCSELSGATRSIEIKGIPLRVAGGQNGTVIFAMSNRLLPPDETWIRRGAIEIEALMKQEGIEILETKVMYTNNTLFGVRYLLDGDGYQHLKELTVE